MIFSRRVYPILLALYTVWAVVGLGVVGLNVGPLAAGYEDFMFQVFAAAVLLAHAGLNWGWGRAAAAFVLVLLLSGAVELLGEQTGFPFGEYVYTERFGPRLATLPLAIPLAWWVILYGCWLLLRSVPWPIGPLTRCSGAALLAVLIDGVIEPVAWHVRGYWLWTEGNSWYGVPHSNYIAWFCVGLVLLSVIDVLVGTARRRNNAPGNGGIILVLQLMVLTFVVSLLANALWPGFFLGLAVMGLIFYLGRHSFGQDQGG